MPRNTIKQEEKINTRNKWTQVDAALVFEIDGKELPSLSVLGSAVEEAFMLIQKRIEESYKVVPERVNTPIAEPYGSKQ